MRAPRWVLGLVAVATAGSAALVVGLPVGSAAAADGPRRYALAAQGDAMYFEVNSIYIPASPANSAGSLTTRSDLDSSGRSQAFVGAPYFGATTQTAPGTVNGALVGFGLEQFGLPFTRLPQYVETRFPTEPKAAEDGANYRIAASSQEKFSKATGETGAPPTIPAPNQQQTSDADVKVDARGGATATSSGSAAGFVTGPLEIGQAVTKANLVDPGNGKPRITSSSFGRFSVSGQEFGYNENGFRYLGQSMSAKDAFAGAGAALEAAGLQIDIAPGETVVNETTGVTTHVIRGLTVTSTTQVADNPVTYVYSLGRAMVSAVNVDLSAARANTVDSGKQPAAAQPAAVQPAPESGKAAPAAAAADQAPAASLPASDELPNVEGAAAAEATEADVSSAVETQAEPQADVGSSATGDTVAVERVKTLGFVPAAVNQSAADGNQALYLLLAATGLALVGGSTIFTRFARR